jgi:hypothetical protein
VILNTGMIEYSPSFTYPNSYCLLPHWQASDLWCGSDSEQLYKTNLEQRPPTWTWENRTVRYTWNKDGYRAPEWGLVDWPITHVIMGCSHVLGVGVNDPDTLSNQLSIQLGEPVVNLGIGGGSAHTIQYNTMRMIELGWKPKSVVIAIPELERMAYFDDHTIHHFTPGWLTPGENSGLLKLYEYWLKPKPHAELYGRMAIKGAEAMWARVGVPVIMRHASRTEGASQMAPNWHVYTDYARDLIKNGHGQYVGHPGPGTLGLRARELVDTIRAL